ncbi:MAG: YdcH family protein [Pseudomonadota bacterium]|jgi:hypothetical protein|nr:YdcH family protein [Pseudomonadota bacterium]MEC9235163.1 YdcH family protein [Pseudomonadota bacterium]MED5422847.1 YdcH family protein [Pseudomonadota bacterium]
MSENNRINALKERKHYLDLKITDEEKRPHPDELILHKLKAQKLHINDQISALADAT